MTGLGLKALAAGHRISFVACHDLVIRHRQACRADREGCLVSALLRPSLPILDGTGCTPLELPEAIFLFEVAAQRYERQKPIIVTSNESRDSWGEILTDQMMTAAILDGLLDR